jgi:dihydroorotase
MNDRGELQVRKIFDRHVHLRSGELMYSVAPYTFLQANAAIVMPNTKPPITTIDMAKKYRERIDLVSGEDSLFTPHIPVYLTDNTNIDELEDGFGRNVFIAGKLYPAGATTNSDDGVTNIRNIHHVFERMQDIGMPLLIHCEETYPAINFFDRERRFITRILCAIREMYPGLKIVIEHVSTKEGVDFVIQNENTWATVTPHHLMKNCNAMFENGLNPFYFCYPVLNSENDRLAIVQAVTSEDKERRKLFGAGTDSAPHYPKDKIKIGGKGGIFNPFATEIYTQAFAENNAKLEYLNDFLAVNLLEDVYGIRPRDEFITLVKEGWTVPEECNGIRPFMAGEKLQWQIKS